MATGFADQSHMGRHFRAMFGMTPGAVARHADSRTF
jgi:transcriptional regulator GlxA family with amidase domain